jgi:hypothetical protein
MPTKPKSLTLEDVVRWTRVDQGLPLTVQDPETLRKVARIVTKATSTAPIQAVDAEEARKPDAAATSRT